MLPRPPRPTPENVTTLRIARATDGDRESLEWLVAHLSPLLRAHANFRLGRSLRRIYDPDDLVHDAWLAALPKLRELCGDPSRRRTPVLLRYLSQTIVFRIGKLARRHARGPAVERDGEPDPELPADVTGAVTRAVQNEHRAQVQQALDELEATDREVVLLRGIEQLSAKATAALLGIGVEAAFKRYQRALARLRGRMPHGVFDELDD